MWRNICFVMVSVVVVAIYSVQSIEDLEGTFDIDSSRTGGMVCIPQVFLSAFATLYFDDL